MSFSSLSMATSYLYAFVVLYSSLKGTYGVNHRCELLEEQTCFGSSLDYNFTTTDLVTDSQTQLDVKDKLKQWEGLKFLSRCWSVLQPLLCQVYKPRCHNKSVQLPCREQCLATRSPCSVVERYNKEWPEFLQCERFPLGGCKGGSVSWQSNSPIQIKMYLNVFTKKERNILPESFADANLYTSRFWMESTFDFHRLHERCGLKKKLIIIDKLTNQLQDNQDCL